MNGARPPRPILGAALAAIAVVLPLAPPVPAEESPGNAAAAALGLDAAEVRRILDLSPLPPPPPSTSRAAGDPHAARLGHALFFDLRLSGDGAASCATCHDPARGFADGRPLPERAGRAGRHTPSLWNVAYNRWFFWDGRADSMWAQALEPIERPDELGGDRLRTARLIHDDPELRRAWEAAFGPLPDLGDRAAVDRVFVGAGKAIEAYERLLVSRRSPFDVFAEGLRAGDGERIAALSPAAVRGLRLFVGRAQCRLCHGGPNFTDGEFHDTGVPSRAPGAPAEEGRERGIGLLRASPFNAGGPWSDDPAGAAAQRLELLAGGPETRGAWKTPTLRNVARTAPYMHQGQLATLRQVLEHYSTLRGAVSGAHHREAVLRPLALTQDEIDDLVAFLESLTDEAIDPALLRPPPPVYPKNSG